MFLILRYFASCLFVTDTVNSVYEKHHPRDETRANRGRHDPRNRTLTPHEAHKIIDTQKTIKVAENEHGTIWKLPDCSKGLQSSAEKANKSGG